jgi:O-antigen/teichoic acid export membrane protein
MAQADRFLVGATLGVATLGVYSVILSLSVVAFSPFYSICSGIGVSVIARNRWDHGRFGSLLLAMIWGFCLFGFAYAAFTGLMLDVLAPGLFGPLYAVDLPTRLMITMIVFLRIVRGPASILLLVDGRTRGLAVANLVAGVGLACSALFVHLAPMLESVLLGVLIGDALSLALFQRFLVQGAPGLARQIMSVLGFELAAVAGLLAALAGAANAGAGARVPIALACLGLAGWIARRVQRVAQGSLTRADPAPSGAASRA